MTAGRGPAPSRTGDELSLAQEMRSVFAAECLEMVEHSRTGVEAAGEDAVMQDVLAQWRGFQCPEGVNGAFPQELLG
ncbi:hypothetical protein OG979_27190 [Actinomadura citrea]|uniref:hypothetical protein n=1 Tax=Actinomadura citrea TaxID=46158 RepID=UPI002E295317|nr:hypothetical protein [Actinomadura citrea]